MPASHRSITIIFIINGQDVAVDVNLEAPLSSAVHRALAQSGNTGRPPDEWEVRDTDGILLEQNRTIEDLGLISGARVFLSLRVGAGGNASRS
jgi:hypothetical protein